MRLRGFFWLAPLFAPLFVAALGGCGASDLGDVSDGDAGERALEAGVEEAEETAPDVGSIQKLTIRGGKLEGGDAQGRPLWRLQAKTIQSGGPTGKSGLPQKATLSDARATLFRAGKPEATFAAKTILFFDTPQGVRLLLTGGVTAQSQTLASKGSGPVKISANRADVDVKNRRLSASGNVSATHADYTLRAAKLAAPTALQTLTASGDVRLNVARPNAPQTQIEARSATVNFQTDRLSAQNVVAKRSDLTIRGQTLAADLKNAQSTLTGAVEAQSNDATARAPRVDWNWNAGRIAARKATLTQNGATLRAASLQTDSNLQAASAENIVVSRNGATLRAASARGFDGLNRLSGTRVSVQNGNLRVEAPRAEAQNWSETGGTIKGEGGVTVRTGDATLRAQNATVSGRQKVVANGNVVVTTENVTARAPRAIWTSTASGGRIEASGGLELRGRGAVLKAPQGQSDDKLQNATLSGGVSATLPDGSVLRAPTLQKRGDALTASNANGTLRSAQGTLQVQAGRVETGLNANRLTASGGVQLRSASGASLKATRAVYEQAASRVTAEGDVVFSDPQRGTVRGDTLRADLKLQNAVLSNPRGQTSGELFGNGSLFD